MLNIIRADLYRIFRSKGFYITTGLLLAFITLQVVASTVGVIGVQVTGNTNTANSANVFTGMRASFEMMSIIDNLLYFILPFIVFVGAVDFSSGTAKNVLSNGMSRGKYYLSKLILSCIFCTVLLFLAVTLATVVGTIKNGFGGTFDMVFIGNVMRPFLAQLFLCISVTCVGIFFVFVTQKTAFVTGAYIAFCMVPMLLFSTLIIINDQFEFLLKYDIISNIRLLANIDTLASADITRAFAIGVFYISVSTVGGLFIFKRSEIK